MEEVTYTKHAPNTIHQKYAKLRTETRTTNESLRNRYERQANDELRKTVELERRHLQQQVDDYKAYANAEIAKALAEADHWRQQVEIIYGLLEDQTRIAEDALKRLARYETAKPVAEVIKPARPKHKKGWSNAQRRKYEEQ